MYDIPKAPSGRELSSERMTEGECVMIKFIGIQNHAFSVRHASQRTPKAHFIRFGEPLPRATFLPEEGFSLVPLYQNRQRKQVLCRNFVLTNSPLEYHAISFVLFLISFFDAQGVELAYAGRFILDIFIDIAREKACRLLLDGAVFSCRIGI